MEPRRRGLDLDRVVIIGGRGSGIGAESPSSSTEWRIGRYNQQHHHQQQQAIGGIKSGITNISMTYSIMV